MNDFYSPTFGKIKFKNIKDKILKFIEDSPEEKYRLVIGTDSQPKNGKGTDFVTAIIIHRVGSGGIYFWRRSIDSSQMVLRNRIYKEAFMSLDTAQDFLSISGNDGISKYDIEIHVDIGSYGKTKDMISEIVGMIRGSGFNVKTKPESYGASKVADRHT